MSVIELASIGEKRSYASTVLPGLILGPTVFLPTEHLLII